MNPIRLLNLGCVSAWKTQAIYHALAEGMDDNTPDTIVICSPKEPYLCLGYHQVFGSIFDLAECERRGLQVYRRRLGGGATYLDKNQLFYQCIFHHSHMPVMIKDIFAYALAAPVDTLNRLGLNAELSDINEIGVEGKRIAGTGGGRIGEATVVVGNLLFDFDCETMAAVWRTPNPAFRQLARNALRESIVKLHELSPELSMAQLTDQLIASFSNALGRPLEPGRMTVNEIRNAGQEAKKLTSQISLALHETNSNPKPVHELKISARAFIHYDEARVKNVDVKGSFWVAGELIHEAILESIPPQEWFSAEQGLRNTPFATWKEQLYKN